VRELTKRAWAVAAVVVAVGVCLSCSERPSSLGTMPDVTLQDLNGQSVAFADFKGKVVIVNFWATWCPPCREEIPSFVRLYSDYKDKGLVIVGVALDEKGKAVVAPFAEKNKINYPIVLDPDNAAQSAFGLGRSFGIPATFIVGRDGGIRQKLVGLRPHSYFENMVKKLLDEELPAPTAQ
jgi:peroxiredoxin